MNRKLSAFDIYVLTAELQDLIGSYVDKTYQLSSEDILVKIRNRQSKKKEAIFVRNGEFICRTEKNIVTPMKPSTFAMTLRKYLSNAVIASVDQHEFDRIIFIAFQKKDTTYKLVLELFSQGNIILLGENDCIITPFNRERWAHRSIKSKEEYKPPPAQVNPFHLSKDSFMDILLSSNADIVRTLASQLNMGGIYAEEICSQANIDKNQMISTLSKEGLEQVFEVFSALINRFKLNDFSPVVVKKNQEIIDVLPFEFISYPDYLTYEKTAQMIQGLESEIIASKEMVQTQQSASSQKIQKLKRRQSQQEKAIQEYEQSIHQKQMEGELIYLHFKEIEELLLEIQQGLQHKEKKAFIQEINNHPLIKRFDPQSNTLIVTLKTLNEKNQVDVQLDFRKSVAENAEHAYKMSKKYKQKQQGAKEAVIITNQKMKSLMKKDENEQVAPIQFKEQPKKSFWFESYRWCLSSNGNIIIGGKDAKTNDQVVKKHLEKNDRYAHADVHGAPSCIIKNRDIHDNSIEITEQTLKEACVFSACYSKAWKQFTEAQAYWVLPNQVSKTPQSGEFVPRGAFIIRGSRHYCHCKLELAIGRTTIDGVEKIMGGPPSAVKQWCSSWVLIIPGKIDKNQAAHQIAEILAVATDEIQKVLPPGGVSITAKQLNKSTNEERDTQ